MLIKRGFFGLDDVKKHLSGPCFEEHRGLSAKGKPSLMSLCYGRKGITAFHFIIKGKRRQRESKMDGQRKLCGSETFFRPKI